MVMFPICRPVYGFKEFDLITICVVFRFGNICDDDDVVAGSDKRVVVVSGRTSDIFKKLPVLAMLDGTDDAGLMT
jgi:hypothetical protein